MAVVWMALPYTIVLTLVGLLCVEFTLMPVTDWLLAHGWLVTPSLPSVFAWVRPGASITRYGIFPPRSGVGSVFVYTAMI